MCSSDLGTPELKVIDSLMHSLATAATGYGYIAKCEPGGGAVYILASSRPTAGPATYGSPMGAPIAAPLVTNGSPDDEIPPVTPFPPAVPPGQPRPGQTVVPGQPAQPGSAPGASTPNFGPVAPSAPGAGRFGGPPATPPPTPPNGGRGGI